MRKFLLCSMLLAPLLAAPAAAQTNGIVTPFLGVTADTPTDENRTIYGGAIGLTGPVVGFEVDLGYAPNFFEADDEFGELGAEGSVTTLMGNLLISAPLGRFRPYGTVGAGLMRSNLKLIDIFDDITRNDFGVNYGVGAMVFLTEGIGLRGDARRFRSLRNEDEGSGLPEPGDLKLGDFGFWRISGGVTFRW
jgi:opacity protein-like surface antigen